MGPTTNSSGLAVDAAAGVFWLTAQKWCSRILGLVTVGVLSRLLSPADFGLVAVALVLVPFVYLLADLGFSTYLVQADDPSESDFATAFWYAAVAGTLLAGALGLLGGPLGRLLGTPEFAQVAWGFAPAIVFTAVGSVPLAKLRRAMKFRLIASQAVIAGILGQVLALGAAFAGWGVWALVIQTSVTQLAVTLLAWVTVRWVPAPLFSPATFAAMVRFGANIVGIEVVALARLWAEVMIVGAALGVTGLGYLSIAQRLIQVAQDLTATAITPVSIVVFAKVRGSIGRLCAAYTRAQSLVYAAVIPAMVLVVVGGEELITLVFGSQWEPSVLPAQALAVAGILTVGASLDHGLFYGTGRPGTWFGYALAIDGLTVATTWVLAPHGLTAVAWGFVGVAAIATVVRWPLVADRLGTSWSALAWPFTRALGMGTAVAAAGVTSSYLAGPLPGAVTLAVVATAVGVCWLLVIRFFLPSAADDVLALGHRLRAGHGLGRPRSTGGRHVLGRPLAPAPDELREQAGRAP